MNEMDTAARILLTTIEILNTHGSEAVTTRRIAESAGVNTAAVNYHFGSRENLLKQAMDMTLSHLFQDWAMILARDELTLPEKVYFFLDYNLEGIARYPGLSRSYMFDRELSGYTRGLFTEKLDEIIDRFSTTPQMKLGISHAMSSVLSVAILPEFFRKITGEEPLSEKARRSFILPLVNRVPGLQLDITLPFLEKVEALRKIAFRE